MACRHLRMEREHGITDHHFVIAVSIEIFILLVLV